MNTDSALNDNERLVLDWLSKEDESSYGECRGRTLDRLVALGLAQVRKVSHHDRNYDRVSLTEAGLAAVAASRSEV